MNDNKNGINTLTEFIENIRESLGVEPSTAAAEQDDDQLDISISDRISQDQVGNNFKKWKTIV